MKLPSTHRVYLEARRAARRFPFVLFCALAGSITALILIESEPMQSVGFPIIFATGLGLPLLAALALFAEGRRWSGSLSMGSQFFGALLLVGYGFSVPTSLPQEPVVYFIRFGLLAAGPVLLVMIAPYLKRR